MTRLTPGTSGEFLQTKGAADDPVWVAPTGVVQVVNVMDGAVDTGTTEIPGDDTIPQQGTSPAFTDGEGDEYMTLAVTPTSATNKLKIDVVFNCSPSVAKTIVLGLFQDATAGALAVTSETVDVNTGLITLIITHYMTAGTTSETTFKVRAGAVTAGATLTFNGQSSGRLFGGVMASSITITEIKV